MEDLVRRKNELQEQQGKKKQGKVPGIVLRGLFLAVAVGVVPLLQKQSPQLKGMVMGYASHAAIARSWELINLLVIALAISYGFISRSRHTHNATANATDDAREQGAQNYVQKIFDFAEVFDNLDKEKAEAWSSRWQPQEPVVVIARDGSGTDHDKEKPLLLPIRSLKSSLSNAELLDFLKDAAVEESGKAPEVRNGTILSVESGNFEEEVSTVVADEEEPAVFPSPIPWALRLDKEAHPLVPAVVNLASDDGKIDPPAIPSPIPWRSRPGPGPDRSVLSGHDGKKKLGTENGDVSDSKPPLPPPQRPPPPPPEMPKRSASPSASPSLGSANGNSQKNMQVPSGIPLQKFPSPSPSPPRPPPSVELTNDISEKNLQASSGTPLHKLPSHAAFVENGSSQKNPNPKPQYNNAGAVAGAQAEEKDPTASAPSFPTVAENGSSVKHHSNGNFSIPKSPQSAVAAVPPALERSGNAPAYATNSRSKSGDDGSYLRGEGRECSSRSSRRRSKIRESSAGAETEAEEGARARRSSRKLELASPISDVPLTPSPLDPDDSPPLPLPPPPPYSDDELGYETTSSSSDLLYQMDDSFSETETEGEVDKKADQFIAKFHEQIRMQRVESMRRSQEER